ncbi:PREDICTED: protein FAM177B-like isoform X1 [Crocodylus porosus]|uniref:protein FAM177B-like isoform X1 n=2 Tax=Crocodylus porosus TaxID=8502 RepID=UPI00093B4BE8|nr:PREDICTED: protein FAM177B-like isoform X1 [Crocodylus porosus]
MEDTKEIIQGEDSISQHNENNIGRGERKSPRRIIYFANGDTMEEYSTEEEEEEEEHQTLDTSEFSWGLYLWFWAVRIASMSFFTCEFLGGKLATLFGLNEPKYQHAIDEYYRTQSKESEDDEDGEEIFEKNEVNSLNEKCHLELQSIGYGSVGLKDPMEFSQRGACANVNEATKRDYKVQTQSQLLRNNENIATGVSLDMPPENDQQNMN